MRILYNSGSPAYCRLCGAKSLVLKRGKDLDRLVCVSCTEDLKLAEIVLQRQGIFPCTVIGGAVCMASMNFSHAFTLSSFLNGCTGTAFSG
jgi:hypothetical protein